SGNETGFGIAGALGGQPVDRQHDDAGESDEKKIKRDDSAKTAANPLHESERKFAEPFVGDPGSAGGGPGVGVNDGPAAGAQNVLADFDVPPHVGIDAKAASFIEDTTDEEHTEHGREGDGPFQEVE